MVPPIRNLLFLDLNVHHIQLPCLDFRFWPSETLVFMSRHRLRSMPASRRSCSGTRSSLGAKMRRVLARCDSSSRLFIFLRRLGDSACLNLAKDTAIIERKPRFAANSWHDELVDFFLLQAMAAKGITLR